MIQTDQGNQATSDRITEVVILEDVGSGRCSFHRTSTSSGNAWIIGMGKDVGHE